MLSKCNAVEYSFWPAKITGRRSKSTWIRFQNENWPPNTRHCFIKGDIAPDVIKDRIKDTVVLYPHETSLCFKAIVIDSLSSGT